MKKIVITGIGTANTLGNNVNDFWENLLAGKCGMKTYTRIPPEKHDTMIAAEMDSSYEAENAKYWKKRQLNCCTVATKIGLVSAGEAVTDSGLDNNCPDGKRVGLIYGVTDTSYEDLERENPLNITLKKMANALPAIVSMKYGFEGPSFTVSTACASAAYAMAIGKQLIESGICDIVIAGGMSNTVTTEVIGGFNQLLAMSANPDPNTAARPFTKNRDGFIMGEGSGSLVLESEESALKRGAKIYCEFAGASMTSEAYNLTAPKTDGEGMSYAIRLALSNAGITPDQVDYINAHGTSTGLNDLYETKAIKEVFGERAYDIPVSSIKGAIGHTLAAGGAIEAIACIKAIETGIVPPTIHYDEPDPELDLNYVPNVPQEHKVDVAISNSFGFGGHNATVVLKRYSSEK